MNNCLLMLLHRSADFMAGVSKQASHRFCETSFLRITMYYASIIIYPAKNMFSTTYINCYIKIHLIHIHTYPMTCPSLKLNSPKKTRCAAWHQTTWRRSRRRDLSAASWTSTTSGRPCGWRLWKATRQLIEKGIFLTKTSWVYSYSMLFLMAHLASQICCPQKKFDMFISSWTILQGWLQETIAKAASPSIMSTATACDTWFWDPKAATSSTEAPLKSNEDSASDSATISDFEACGCTMCWLSAVECSWSFVVLNDKYSAAILCTVERLRSAGGSTLSVVRPELQCVISVSFWFFLLLQSCSIRDYLCFDKIENTTKRDHLIRNENHRFRAQTKKQCICKKSQSQGISCEIWSNGMVCCRLRLNKVMRPANMTVQFSAFFLTEVKLFPRGSLTISVGTRKSFNQPLYFKADTWPWIIRVRSRPCPFLNHILIYYQ